MTDDLTQLIQAARTGDDDARDRLLARVYDELRKIARQSRFVGEHGLTMQPTALAHEAILQLEQRFPAPPHGQPESRRTFFRSMSLAMRTLLRDHWRQKHAAKRGGDRDVVPIGDASIAERESGELDRLDFLALDESLNRLEQYNARWFEVVMHRYFSGLSLEETASLLECGLTTTKSDWKLARAWLRRDIEGRLS